MTNLGAWARAAIWLLVGAAVLALGFGLLGGGILALEMVRRSEPLGEVQLDAWGQLYRVVLFQGLWPHLVATLVLYLLAAIGLPRLDQGWGRLAATLLLASFLSFPLVGFVTFGAWQPTSSWDVVATMALMAIGATLSLLIARRLLPGLAPGALARRTAAAAKGNEAMS